MEKQNYYLLLELPYDPPEHNYDTIKKAIQKKRALWTRRLSNAKYRSEAEEFFSLIERMEIDMQDRSFREAEAQDAKELGEEEERRKRIERYEKLDKIILILSKKGYVLDEEVESIQRDLGFTQDEIITNIVSVPVQKSKNGKKQQGKTAERPELTKEKMNSICSILDKVIAQPRVGKVATLYDLLELSEGTGERDLYEKANAEYKALSSKGAVSGELLSQKDALSHALTIFKDQDTRLKYDESLKTKRFEYIEEFIKVAGSTGEIEQSVYEELKIQTMNEGLSSTDAEAKIKRSCDIEKIQIVTKQQQTNHPKIELEQCGCCGLVNRIDASFCIGCGQSLVVECKKCNAASPSSSKNCSSCGIPLISFYYQEHYLKRAKWALVNKNFRAAQEMVDKAKYYWSGLPAINILSNQITNAYQLAEKQVHKVEELIAESKFYSAESELARLKQLHPQLDTIPAIERDIRRHINSAESYLIQARATSTDKEKIAYLLLSIEESADCRAALTELNNFPPEPPKEVRAGMIQDSIKLEWNSPYKKGDVLYEVYRQEGTEPAKKMAETDQWTFADKKAEPGKRYSYYVQTLRGSKVSAKSSIVGNLMKTSEVDSLRAQVAKEGILLTWKSPANTKIEVWKKEGSIPQKRGDGMNLSDYNQNGLLDKDVEKDKEYGYLVVVQYADERGKPFFSRGSGLMAIHTAETVGPIAVDEQKDHIHFNWSPGSVGNMKFIYSDFPFNNYKANECLAFSEVAKEAGNGLIDGTSEGHASIKRNVNGILNILPVLKIGGCAIIGEPFILKTIAPVSKVAGKREKDDLVLQWHWPLDTNKVTIRYSKKGFNDPAAEERECSKFSYDNFGGYKVDSVGENQDVFVTVFVTEDWEGEKFHSKPVKFVFTEREPMEIRYSISVQKKMLGLKKEATIKIRVPKYGLPNLALVKQKGRIPNRKSDGEIITRIESIHDDQSNEYIVRNLNEYLEEDSFAKLFFESKEDAQNYKIIAEPGTKFALFS